MKPFVEACTSGILPSGQQSQLNRIPLAFWRDQWLYSQPLLGQRPAVGGPTGAQPDIPNDRVMEAFGSSNYPYPFMAVDAQINGAKGRIMQPIAPTALRRIAEAAQRAVRDDSEEAADELLQMIRVVSGHASGTTSFYKVSQTDLLSKS